MFKGLSPLLGAVIILSLGSLTTSSRALARVENCDAHLTPQPHSVTAERVTESVFENLTEFEATPPTIWFLPDEPTYIDVKPLHTKSGEPSPVHRKLTFGTYEKKDIALGRVRTKMAEPLDAKFFLDRLEVEYFETPMTTQAWKALPYSSWFALFGDVRAGDVMILIKGSQENPVLEPYLIVEIEQKFLGTMESRSWGSRGNTEWNASAIRVEAATREAKRRGLSEVELVHFDRTYDLFQSLLDRAIADFRRIRKPGETP